MKKAFPKYSAIALALIVSLALWTSRDALAAGKFVYGFDDLPLMPGMTEIPGADVSFDTASGRIVIAFARSAVDQKKIMAFYDTTLSQLGWRKKSLVQPLQD